MVQMSDVTKERWRVVTMAVYLAEKMDERMAGTTGDVMVAKRGMNLAQRSVASTVALRADQTANWMAVN